MENTAKLIEEIRQITIQYKAEVSGNRKQWPKAIKIRVMQLCALNFTTREIAEQTGVSFHTVAAWKTEQNQKKFHPLPVMIEATPKPVTKNIGTVTDTKNSKETSKENKSSTVTVTTPDGFILEVGSAKVATEIILQLRKA